MSDENAMRTFSVEIYPATEDQEGRVAIKRDLLNGLNQYRHVCRQLLSRCALAQAAGATVSIKKGYLQVKCPPKKTAEQLLALATGGKTSNNLMYPCREQVKEMAPTWASYLHDQVLADVKTLWTGKDPHIPTSYGSLFLNSERRLKQLTSLPITLHRTKAKIKFENHRVAFEWDKAIGPVEWKVRRLDGGRYGRWRAICEGKLEHRSLKVRAKRSREFGWRVFLDIPFVSDVKPKKLNPKRVAELNFLDTGDMVLTLRQGHRSSKGIPVDDVRKEAISVAAAIAGVDQKKIQDERLLMLLRACGRRGECRRGEGNSKAARSYSRRREGLSISRAKQVKSWNHAWSKRVVARLVNWDCGGLIVFDVPATLNARPWQWHQFQESLKYKCEDAGVKLTFSDSPKAKDLMA